MLIPPQSGVIYKATFGKLEFVQNSVPLITLSEPNFAASSKSQINIRRQ